MKSLLRNTLLTLSPASRQAPVGPVEVGQWMAGQPAAGPDQGPPGNFARKGRQFKAGAPEDAGRTQHSCGRSAENAQLRAHQRERTPNEKPPEQLACSSAESGP